MRQKPLKMPLSLFYVGHLLLGTGLGSSMVCVPSENPLEKTNPFFESRYQLEVASVLRMGACPLPVSEQEPYQAHSHADTTHANTISGSLCVGPAVLRSLVFLAVFVPTGSYTLSSSSSTEFPEGRELMETSI